MQRHRSNLKMYCKQGQMSACRLTDEQPRKVMDTMRYEVTKDLETGNAIIDGEHRELFRAVNTLLDACGQGQGRAALDPTIKFLLNYVDKHFTHEEQLQAKSNYPGMPAHKQFHESYKLKLREIANKISTSGGSIADIGLLNGHIAVLVNHIKFEDKKLGAFLNK